MCASNIKKIAKSYGVDPLKSLGQNFLQDEFIINEIVYSANLKEGAHVLEIGPGLGNMTEVLISSDSVRKVTAVEFDSRCIERLNVMKLTADKQNKLVIIQEDALRFKEEDLDGPISIVSNLPYNIGTKLILKWVEKIKIFDSVTVMLQKEVAERIIASPSNKSYGRLSIFTQLFCSAEKMFDVPRDMFWPAPKVDSSVIRMTPRKNKLYECNIKDLEFICKNAFVQRRKFLSKNLKPVFGDKIDKIFQDLEISPKARAEELDIEKFCQLANLYTENIASKSRYS